MTGDVLAGRDPRRQYWVQSTKPELEGKLGTTFTLSNGLLGLRGAHEECPSWGRPEFYVAGTYAGGPASLLGIHDPDHILTHPDRMTEEALKKMRPDVIWTLPNLPFPVGVRLTVGGVEFTHEKTKVLNGHTLVWHHQCPDWFFRDGDQPAGRALVLRRMRAHVTTVAKHFAGKVQSWDVVNEAIADGDGYLRQSKWVTSIGEDFIAKAFLAARRADPKAELYYNDYGIERPAKREKALRLIRDLKKHKVPIQGIGIQGHWELDKVPFEAIEEAILAFHKEGLAVAITELDIDVVPRKYGGADVTSQQAADADPYPNGLPPEIQQRQADQYARLFALFLKHHDKISRVTFWGLHDGRTWLNSWPSKRTNHPLLWDRALRPKPAFSAVLAIPGPALSLP